jgi:hypothetical protein
MDILKIRARIRDQRPKLPLETCFRKFQKKNLGPQKRTIAKKAQDPGRTENFGIPETDRNSMSKILETDISFPEKERIDRECLRYPPENGHIPAC